MNTFMLYAVSFLTNAAILVFEITGGRLLAPYLGTTVGVWAGLIAVVLGGMAIGYRYGGFIADKNASQKTIGWYLFAAALAALLSWSLRDLVPTYLGGQRLSETWSALCVGTILFMPTVILLAAVSPMVAKNLITRLDSSAKVVGTINAVGTIGSIVGAIATGVFLIPFFGVDVILLGVAVTLFTLSLFVFGHNRKSLAAPFIVIVIAALLVNGVPTKASGAVADVSTAYNRIFVTHTRFGGDALAVSISPSSTQCAMLLDEKNAVIENYLAFPYQQAHALVVKKIFPDGPDHILFLGGCIYSLPRALLLSYPNASADVVEIDPGMTKVASTYFNFHQDAFPSLSLHYDDARVFVNTKHGPYDVVVLDAFGGGKSPPFHVTTQEMDEHISDQLTDDGILIVNVIGSYEGDHTDFVKAYTKTMSTVFPHVALYQFANHPTELQNFVLVASRTRALPDSISDPAYSKLELTKVDVPTDLPILTDTYAPVERLSE